MKKKEERSSQACRELLERELGNLPVAKRPMLQGSGRAVLLGLYGVGGFRGDFQGHSDASRYHSVVELVCAVSMPNPYLDHTVCIQEYQGSDA